MTEGHIPIDAEKVKQLIKEILAIVDEVPDPYKEACFEVLLSRALGPISGMAPSWEEGVAGAEPIGKPAEFTIPDDVIAFLSQHEIPESVLSSHFTYENGELRRRYKIVADTRAGKQIRAALLAALENALKGEKFEFSYDQVTRICTQYDCYDSANFNTNFESKRAHVLFRNLSDKEHVELSPDGKEELAKIVKENVK